MRVLLLVAWSVTVCLYCRVSLWPRSTAQLVKVSHDQYHILRDPYQFTPPPLSLSWRADAPTHSGSLKRMKEEEEEECPPSKIARKVCAFVVTITVLTQPHAHMLTPSPPSHMITPSPPSHSLTAGCHLHVSRGGGGGGRRGNYKLPPQTAQLPPKRPS